MAEEITYESLVKAGDETSYTSHIVHFKELFSLMDVDTFLECGCGYSTKYFIDNCKKVISIEFETWGANADWMNKCKEMFKDESNWEGIMYKASDDFSWACGYQNSIHRDPALINNAYVSELDRLFTPFVNDNKIDVAFVDAGVYVRGDMVEILLQKNIPVVIAHDTECDKGTDVNVYGWFKIKSTSNYEKIFINKAMGTTFYIRKDFPQIIEGMKKHSSEYK